MKDFLTYLAVGTGSFVAIQLNEFLPSKGVNAGLSIIISSFTSLIVYYIIEFILVRLPGRIRWVRKKFFPESIFEGYWIQTVNNRNRRFYTIVDIRFYEPKGTYIMRGATYWASGEPYSTWTSTYVGIDPASAELTYLFNAYLINVDNAETIRGSGQMRLDDLPMLKLRGGSGYFTDQGIEPIKCAYRFEEIPPSILAEATKINKQSFLDAHQLVVNRYHTLRGAMVGLPQIE